MHAAANRRSPGHREGEGEPEGEISTQPAGHLGVRALSGLVRAYQLVVSPWFAPRCRYYPSCSAYAIDALRAHGVFRGTALAAWRLLRCNPWSRGGVDHVPGTAAQHVPSYPPHHDVMTRKNRTR